MKHLSDRGLAGVVKEGVYLALDATQARHLQNHYRRPRCELDGCMMHPIGVNADGVVRYACPAREHPHAFDAVESLPVADNGGTWRI